MKAVVLIADLVKSREVADRARFQRFLKAVLGETSGRRRDSLLSPLTLTLGDEFQAVYANWDDVFRDVLGIMSRIYPKRIRVAIGHGALDTDVNPKAALEMDGPSFVQARDLMDQLKALDRSVIQIATSDSLTLDMHNAGLRLFFHEFDRWNSNAVRMFDQLMNGASATTISEELGISVRAVHKAMKTHAMSDAVAFIQSLSEDLNTRLPADTRSPPVG